MSRRKKADEQLEDAFANAQVPDPKATTQEEDHASQTEAGEAQAAQEGAGDDQGAQGQDDDQLSTLQRSFEELKQQNERIEREAADARRQLENANASVETYRRQAEQTARDLRQVSTAAIENGITQTKKNIEILKAESARSAAAGDWAAFTEAQEALTQNTVHLHQLAQAKEQSVSTQRDSNASSSNDEEYIATLTPRTQSWVRQHQQDLFSTTARRNKAQAAHFDAVALGYEPDTEKYFAHLDQYLGYSKPATQQQQEKKQELPPQQREQGAVASAPPARSTLGQKRNNEVRLTKDQKEAAIAMYPDKKPEEAVAFYAEHVKQIQSGQTHLSMSADKYGGVYKR